RQVQVRRAGTTKWQAPKRRDTLGAGDALRTRRGNNTLVQLGDGADLTVGSNSVLELGPVGQAGDSLRATYTLQEGNARVRLRRKGKQDRHEIVAGGNTLTLRPGPSLGDVEISQKKGRVRVEVRLGTVSLQDGTV